MDLLTKYWWVVLVLLMAYAMERLLKLILMEIRELNEHMVKIRKHFAIDAGNGTDEE